MLLSFIGFTGFYRVFLDFTGFFGSYWDFFRFVISDPQLF